MVSAQAAQTAFRLDRSGRFPLKATPTMFTEYDHREYNTSDDYIYGVTLC